MTLQLIEGFDHYNSSSLAGRKSWVTGSPWASGGGRLGGGCLNANIGSNSPGPATIGNKLLPSTYTTLIAGFAFNWINESTDSRIFIFQNSGSIIASLILRWSDKILLVQNGSGTTIATGVTPLIQNVWYYIEVKLVINGASGTCEVRLNGVTGEIASTTGNFGSTACNQINMQIGSTTVPGSILQHLYDDMYVLDTSGASPRNTWLGDVRVETSYPTSDGAHTAWIPNSGTTHFNRVNQNPPDDDTTYVSSSNPGDIDTYGMSSTTLSGTIFGVQTNLYARKDNANARQIAPVIRQAGTDYVGTTSAGLSTSYIYYSQIYNQDPTGSDWTIASVNADEFGVKEIT